MRLLVLDIDETLLYASTKALERQPDFTMGRYSVYLRPHLQKFLDFAFEHFRVGIWTSATRTYAQKILAPLLKDREVEFLWTRERCTRRIDPETQETVFIKDLKKLKRRGYCLEEILVVDDSPEKIQRQYGNFIRVAPFYGSTEDRELALLPEYLLRLDQIKNVRKVEKRNWRQQITADTVDKI